MKTIIQFLVFLQLLFVATIFSQTQPSIGEILNADGSVRLDRDGGYDVEGYKMLIDKDGKPRFLSKTESALSDSGNWNSVGTGPGIGVNGTVSALAVYKGELYVGGSFTEAGVVSANYIARWNGSNWNSVGTGSGNGVGGVSNPSINALAVYNEELYVGGFFDYVNWTGSTTTSVKANRIARWNGISWNSVGTGSGNGVSGTVFALTVYSGELYVGGGFNLPGNNIVRWNGTSWNTLGTGSNNGVSGGFLTVRALAVYNGELYVGGNLTSAGGASANRIARWNGMNWNTLGTGSTNGVNGEVRTMAVYNGELYVGGDFTQAGGANANRIARWNGSNWNTLGTGSTNGVNGRVIALAVYNDELYVGGAFGQASGVSAKYIVRWNGTSWNSVGTGLGNGVNSDVYALAVYNGGLYVGGDFTEANWTGSVSSSLRVNYVAHWNGTSWNSIGASSGNGTGTVYALAVYNGELYVGGNISQAGGASANNIARWNGTSWNSVGTGSNNGVNNWVYALAVYNGELYVGGWFTQAGGVSANRIARWNGSSWNGLGTGSGNGVGGGSNPSVKALAVYNGELYVGGVFTRVNWTGSTSTSLTAENIARWNGSSWNSVGTGLGNGVNSDVYALVVFNGELYVGGNFLQAGGSTANRIARWNGSSWNSVGNGVNNVVNALAVHNGELYVAGGFTTAGGESANYIARWNGTSWNTLGTGSANGVNNYVFTLAIYNGELYVGGRFTQAGGVNSNYIARWNGTSWNTLGTGSANGVYSISNPIVQVLTEYNGELYVGGNFTSVGGLNANNIARWTIGGATDVEENEITPTNFVLHQNYPNPFNPSTTISFTIPKSSYVTLKVYDMLGRVVAELVNNELQAGSHSINFDASRLSSGTYFYRLQAGNFVQVKKMMIMK